MIQPQDLTLTQNEAKALIAACHWAILIVDNREEKDGLRPGDKALRVHCRRVKERLEALRFMPA